MSEAQFYTFLTGGLALLIALMLLIAWNLWRIREDAKAGRLSALEGVAHEMRINLQRMVSELSQVATNAGVGPDVLLPIRHPQLDGVNGSLINANRNGIAVVGSTYQELEARKLGLRAVLAQGREPGTSLDDAMDATINGIAALYMWEVHKGAKPGDVGTVRSWSVRDWMKDNGFRCDVFPGMHLRDEVVERLRLYGLQLTPRPLTHTAFEYYSMQYDRYADRRGPLGLRRASDENGEPKGRGGLFGLFGGRKKAEAAEEDMPEDGVFTDEDFVTDDAPDMSPPPPPPPPAPPAQAAAAPQPAPAPAQQPAAAPAAPPAQPAEKSEEPPRGNS